MNTTTLRVLLALGEEGCTAADMLERLADVPGGVDAPSLPALYRHLKVGLDEGWLTVIPVGDGTPGRPRQIYQLTSSGKEAIAAQGRRLRALAAFALGEVEEPGATR